VKKIILFAFWLWAMSVTIAQGTFVKTYDFGTVEDSYQMLYYNNRIFVNTATYCGVECSYLSEIDTLANILWRTEVPDIDIATGTMVIVNDTITVTGNNDPYNTAWRMAHFTLDGEKIGETFEIDHPTEKYTRMFQLTTQYFNGKYVICGAGRQGDIRRSLIYIVDKNGALDTLIAIEPTNLDSDVWDSYIDSQGRLTTYHWVEQHNSIINYRKIFKFDENYDTVWTYRSEDIDYNRIVPRGCELHDGRTILSYSRPEGDRLIHSIRAINTDGSVDWQYDYTWSGSRTREIRRLKTLRNEDIIGAGRYSELAEDPRIGDSPWLFRMSADGQLLWERTYYEFDSTIGQNGSSRRGTLYDFIELENGDILAVGNFRYEDNDMLIMRVDSNGCLDPDDCNEVNILTGTKEVDRSNHDILLYPNPVRDVLNIEFETNEYQLDIEVIDVSGRAVITNQLTSGLGSVETGMLPSGVYLISIKHRGRIIAIEKFSKVGG
jgi:Secretion system C-terminal sorting domain